MRGDTVKQPNQAPTKTGYRFGGWYRDRTYSEEYDFSAPLKEVGYCYAKWEPICYTVRFLANGSDGTMPDQNLVYDQPQLLSANLFTKRGHQFYVWGREFPDGRNPLYYYNQGSVRNLTTKDGDVVELKAYFKPATFTVKFVANGGTGEMSKQEAVYGEQTQLNPNTFTRTGYNFVGWEYNGQTYPDETVIDQLVDQETTLTLTAVWQPISYTVVYLPDEQNAEQDAIRVTVNYDERFSLLYASYRVGYHVSYWLNRDTNEKYSTTTEQSNLATTDGQVVYLTPTWAINEYVVQFYYKAPPATGRCDQTIRCQWDQPFTLAVPTGKWPKGYHLIGYTLDDGTSLVPNADGQYVNIVDAIKHGAYLNVYGAYEANAYSVYLRQEATDNYDLLGTFAYDEQFILPTLPTKEHYTQVGWLIKTNYGQWQRVEPIDQTAWLVWKLSANDGGKVYLRPKWVGDSYTVIFDGNGADSGEMPAETCEFGVTYYLTKNNFVKAGYFFAGWQDNNQVYADQSVFGPTTYTAVITLTAIWAPVYGKGSGTADDPYQIATTDDFYQLATLIADYSVYCKAYYQLNNDLDFGGAAATFTKFQGVFDGQGHVIKNVTYAANNLRSGLFGLCLNATIKNLGVENYHLTLNSVFDSGGLVAVMYDATLSNCYAVGTVTGNQTFACSFGGLVGEANKGLIENCYADVNLMMTNTSVYLTEVGGLAGKASAVIKDSYAIVNLTLEFNKHSSSKEKLLAIAGLVGTYFGTSPITNCFAVVDLTVNIAATVVDGCEPLVSAFANLLDAGTCDNCYVAVTAFNYAVDGQEQPASSTTATAITADNFQDEDWVTTNLFTDSTAWVCRDGEYPQLKVFKE